MYAIQSEQLKNCCGIYLLHNFFKNEEPVTVEYWGRTEADRKRNYPAINIDQVYVDKVNKDGGRENKEQYLERIRTKVTGFVNKLKNEKAYYLAVLNEQEAKQIEHILLDCGFEILVPLTKNPTGSSIITYICHLLPRPIKKKVVQSVIPRKPKV